MSNSARAKYVAIGIGIGVVCTAMLFIAIRSANAVIAKRLEPSSVVRAQITNGSTETRIYLMLSSASPPKVVAVKGGDSVTEKVWEGGTAAHISSQQFQIVELSAHGELVNRWSYDYSAGFGAGVLVPPPK